MQYYKAKYTIYKRYLLHMQSYIEYIPSLPFTCAISWLWNLWLPLDYFDSFIDEGPSTGPLPLSLYALHLSQLSNIAICQKRSRSFPATAICMRTRQHGVPTHSFIRIHSSSVFPFPFSILNFQFDSIRFSTILNYPHWMFDRCPPSAALETFRAFLFVICFRFPSI